MMKVTEESLRAMGACEFGIRWFSAVFPHGMVVNKKNLRKALDAGLEVHWWAVQLCGVNSTDRDEYFKRADYFRSFYEPQWNKFVEDMIEVRKPYYEALSSAIVDVLLKDKKSVKWHNSLTQKG
jgi:hypothetical protein